ncbi:MAG: tRNA (N6-isopentenyl adenosine(37)-C2)-methylthiotransferase MiaB [Alphaproteobacteria bacterium]
MQNKFYIKTYGCQMNVYDSSRIADILIKEGYEHTDDINNADLVLLNTCHIREKAAEKVFSDLGRIKLIKDAKKEEGKDLSIAVCGCVAQAVGDYIIERAPYVDLTVGPQAYHKIPEMLAQHNKQKKHKSLINIDFPEESKFDFLPEIKTSNYSSFLAIQEGCDRFCSYCVVPYTRGIEYSRPVQEVLKEAKKLIDLGALELNLLGQNVNAWHGLNDDGKEWDLARLLYELAEINGLERIRYTTSYPADMTPSLIKAHGDIAKLMPYLHLPVQSGSDTILKKMNRRHNSSDYLKIIDALKETNPNMAFSSDFIVGFPGETDDDFQKTLDIVDRVGFAQAFSFKYSKRPGTPAAEMPNQVEEKVKEERLAALQEVINKNQLSFNKSFINQKIDILIDGVGNKEGQKTGKSPFMQTVCVDAEEEFIGKITTVTVVKAGANSLTAKL